MNFIAYHHLKSYKTYNAKIEDSSCKIVVEVEIAVNEISH